MRLISIGDKIAPGKYLFHSRFQRAINYISDGALLTCLLPDFGGGPSHLVLDELPFDDSPVEIKPHQVTIGKNCFSREGIDVFDSKIIFSGVKLKILNSHLVHFRQAIQQYAPMGSLVFMIASERCKPAESAFEQALQKRLQTALDAFQAEKWLEAVQRLKGSGSGLTPAGDDFIAGWLLGVNLLDQAGSLRARERINLVYSAGLGENIFSNHYLALAREGRGVAAVKNLIDVLGAESAAAIDPAVARIARMGSTSGIDMAVGLWMTLSKNSGSCAGQGKT